MLVARLLADAVLVLHVAIVVFVVGGLGAVLLGNRRGRDWGWVNGLGFRLAHLAAIGIVAAQAWLGRACPLTILESWLRLQAGAAPYERSFVEYWLQRLLYHEAPPWVFTLGYTVFALGVLAAWWRFPPRHRRHGSRRAG